MASFVYTIAKVDVLKGTIDFDGDDIRVAAVMTNTTCDTEEDVALMNGFTTLDEMDGANYARIALLNEVVNTDNTNDRGEFDADNITWSSLGAGTRDVAGLVVYKHVTNDTDSVPICYIDSGGFPFTANGGDLTIQWNAEGILQAT